MLNARIRNAHTNRWIFQSVMIWRWKSIFGAFWPRLPSIRTHVHHTSLNTIKTIIVFALMHMRFYAFSIIFSKSHTNETNMDLYVAGFFSLRFLFLFFCSIHLHNIYIISDLLTGKRLSRNVLTSVSEKQRENSTRKRLNFQITKLQIIDGVVFDISHEIIGKYCNKFFFAVDVALAHSLSLAQSISQTIATATVTRFRQTNELIIDSLDFDRTQALNYSIFDSKSAISCVWNAHVNGNKISFFFFISAVWHEIEQLGHTSIWTLIDTSFRKRELIANNRVDLAPFFANSKATIVFMEIASVWQAAVSIANKWYR